MKWSGSPGQATSPVGSHMCTVQWLCTHVVSGTEVSLTPAPPAPGYEYQSLSAMPDLLPPPPPDAANTWLSISADQADQAGHVSSFSWVIQRCLSWYTWPLPTYTDLNNQAAGAQMLTFNCNCEEKMNWWYLEQGLKVFAREGRMLEIVHGAFFTD